MFAGGIFLAAFVIFSLVLACWQVKPSDAGRAPDPFRRASARDF
jgi:hypothetical protein